MTIPLQTIHRLIQKEFSIMPSGLKRIKMGVMNFNFSFSAGGFNYIIRISPKGKTRTLEFEYFIMKLLYENNCKVPRPKKISEGAGFSYMIYRALEGTPLSSVPASIKSKKSLATSIVKNIDRIATIDKKLVDRGTLSTKYYKDWQQFLIKVITEGKRFLQENKTFKQADIGSTFRFLSGIANSFPPVRPKLIWSDISQDNIIISNNKLSGFIDFEGCFFGDPVLPLGYLFAIEGNSSFFKSIADEYAKFYKFTEETIYFYAILRIYRLAPYLNLPLPTGRKRDPIDQYFKGISVAISNLK